jgi:hypothetical protein
MYVITTKLGRITSKGRHNIHLNHTSMPVTNALAMKMNCIERVEVMRYFG